MEAIFEAILTLEPIISIWAFPKIFPYRTTNTSPKSNPLLL
jgi:hypothetical protein